MHQDCDPSRSLPPATKKIATGASVMPAQCKTVDLHPLLSPLPSQLPPLHLVVMVNHDVFLRYRVGYRNLGTEEYLEIFRT